MREALMKCDFGRVVFSLPGEVHWNVLEGPVFWDRNIEKGVGRFEDFFADKSADKQQFVFREFAEHGALGCIEGNLIQRKHIEYLKQEKWFDIHQNEKEGGNEYVDSNAQHMMFTNWVTQVKTEIALGNFSKIVAARKERWEGELDRLNVVSTLVELRKQFANAMVFALQLGDEVVWMGCTPEKLMVLEEGLAHVHALAGTLTKDQDPAWTSKEEHEQQVTHDFVAGILLENGVSDYRASTVGEVLMGDIKHLATEYIFSLPYERVFSWIDQLHPTPAVGGWPQKEAWRWLDEQESLDRKFYSGWLGLLNASVQSAQIFVTLRCAEINKEGIFLYAGGGINDASDPETEWKETAAKMNVMKKSLQFWEA